MTGVDETSKVRRSSTWGEISRATICVLVVDERDRSKEQARVHLSRPHVGLAVAVAHQALVQSYVK